MGSEMGKELNGYFEDRFDKIEGSIEDALMSGIKGMFEGSDIGKTIRDRLGAQMKGILGGVINDMLFGTGSAGGGGGGGGGGGIADWLKAVGGMAGGGKGGGGGMPSGGLLENMLGSELSFFSGGLGGVLGGIMGLGSLYQSFSKKYKPAMSGVSPIFGTEPRIEDVDIGELYGSGIFETAAFSSRNVGNELLRSYMEPRMGPDVTVHIKPSREFDAISENKWVVSSKLNEMAGIPRRTNFNHG